MNRQSAIALGVAVFIGLLAVYFANLFFSGVEESTDTKAKQVQIGRIVVATQPIELGGQLTNTNVALRDWPAGSIPAGSFGDLGKATQNRIALQKIEAGEPILATRVSGLDGRASLSVRLAPDRYAISIPVNEVSGVAGFVRPGDLVDVLLTRQMAGSEARQTDKFTDVVMKSVPVLAVDQVQDATKTDAVPGKTATLDVDLRGAQKLALARELGTLTLALRNVATPAEVLASSTGPTAPTVTPRDLGNGRYLVARRESTGTPRAPAAAAPARARATAPVPYRPKMTIFRKGVPTEYEVGNAF